jgi:hypothetical protein
MIPPALAVIGKVCASRGLGLAGARNELERGAFGGRVGFEDSSSAEADLLDGMVWERERVKRGLVAGA